MISGTWTSPSSSEPAGRRWFRTPLLLALALLFLAACDCDGCTTEFRVVHLQVRNPDGTPAENVSIRVVRASDEADLTSLLDPTPAPSTYQVANDNMTSEVSERGTVLRVMGSRGELSFETTFVIGTDECGCHIRKIAGPDEVTLE